MKKSPTTPILTTLFLFVALLLVLFVGEKNTIVFILIGFCIGIDFAVWVDWFVTNRDMKNLKS